MLFVFVDESGDPGKPYRLVGSKKIPTGASRFYIVTVLPVDSKELFIIEREMIKIKHKYKFQKEIKSTTIPLTATKSSTIFSMSTIWSKPSILPPKKKALSVPKW